MSYTLYIVEDDAAICSLLQAYLEKYGYTARIAEDFERIAEEFRLVGPDLVLLDVNLPKFDGFYWCRKIRELSKVPILFISARESGMDQVMALENGADDYITKPFSYEVVLAKVKSHLRRAYGDYARIDHDRTVRLDGLTLYPERMTVEYKGKTLILANKEALLLECLMEAYPRAVSRNHLLEKLWDPSHFVEENTLNVNVTRLRKKLQDLDVDTSIETIRGMGYRLQQTGRDGVQ
ncbi:response regulator transcription factor [Paenibacillus humicola]|uniref:response regulator transcription factor n=1 Tax=Paenibacillus humicola TaxID=3110540 RepID=UPI00237A94A0|nr:response regulator transcription factor [Paenibacillus humicola]